MYLLYILETEKPKAIIGAAITAATSDKYLRQNNKMFVLFQTGKAIAGHWPDMLLCAAEMRIKIFIMRWG